MTLERILAWAKTHGRTSYVTMEEVCQAVIDMLGESLPCGYPTPGISRAPEKEALVNIDPIGDGPDEEHAGTDHWVNVGEARAWAAAILRACDEAEEI